MYEWMDGWTQWCEQDSRCHRLLLTDLLISPMQLCTKVPLMLNNILRHTVDPLDKLQLSACLETLEKSLSKSTVQSAQRFRCKLEAFGVGKPSARQPVAQNFLSPF